MNIDVNTILFTLFLIAIIMMLLLINNLKSKAIQEYDKIEGFLNTNGRWKRNPDCKYVMSKTVKKILDDNNVKKTKRDDWDLYLPCTYNNIKKEVKSVQPRSEDQRVFVIDGADEITSKRSLWRNLKKYYDLKTLTTMLPNTYVLSDENDIIRLKRDYKPDNLYILKKDIQRQEGLKITKDLNEILKAKKEHYVVVQELLQNPYLIDKRKINMRFYVLVSCFDNKVSCYVYNNGFMYYTKIPFIKGVDTWENNITTGYIDRKVYEKNPLTHDDFREYLDNLYNSHNLDSEPSEIVFGRIYELLSKIMSALQTSICVKTSKNLHTSFQLFGADIGLNENLEPVLIEINKGPDMGAKDKRDGDLKHGVLNDAFTILDVVKSGHIDNFYKLF